MLLSILSLLLSSLSLLLLSRLSYFDFRLRRRNRAVKPGRLNMGILRITRVSAVAALALLAPWVDRNSAQATPVVWTLKDVEFNDGGTATGFFVFDADILGQTPAHAFDIETSGGDPFFEPFRYTPQNATHALQTNIVFPGNGGTVPFAFFLVEAPCFAGQIDCFRGFGLTFAFPPTNAGGVIPVKPAVNNAFSNEVFVGTKEGIRLVISGELVGIPVTVAALTVALDVRPGSAKDPINPKSNGVIPVAILGTSSFDASTVDQVSVRFGTGQASPQGRGQFEDVNGDGQLDLVLHFRTQDAGIQCGDTSVSITGQTLNGIPIQGSDSITTVGCKPVAGNQKKK